MRRRARGKTFAQARAASPAQVRHRLSQIEQQKIVYKTERFWGWAWALFWLMVAASAAVSMSVGFGYLMYRIAAYIF